MEYTVIKSNRKTLSVTVSREGEVIVKAPYGMTNRRISAFLKENEAQIEKMRQKALSALARAKSDGLLSEADVKALTAKAKAYLPGRVAYYAGLLGVTYGNITVRRQKTRWGSCSAQGNLNFNCLLMLTPPKVIDSVVVHELCHRKEMNHSPRFYTEVYRVFPEYDKWHGWLKKNGSTLMDRMFCEE